MEKYSLYYFNGVYQLKKMDDSHHEATEKEVERILGYLKSYYQDDREFKAHLMDVILLKLWHYYVLMHLFLYYSKLPDIVL